MWVLFEIVWSKLHRAKSIWFDVIELESGRVIHLKGNDMSYILPDDKKVTLSIQPVDARGNPAKIDGVPAWSSSDPAVLEVTPAADGLSAVAVPVGPLGVVQVNVQADADLGEGVEEISDVIKLTVVGAAAKNLGLTVGTPELKPSTP